MLTPIQTKALETLIAHKNVLLYGGAGSGKTFFALTYQVFVAMTTTARCLTTRRYATDVRSSIWNQTLPTVLRTLNLASGTDYSTNEQQMRVMFNSGGEIILGGLDDKERVDKILGQEFSVIYVNECQDVPWPTVNILKTRLRQVVPGFDNRFLADLNPTTDAHWSYKLWHKNIHPETKEPIKSNLYGFIKMSPEDNRDNLSDDYIDTLSNLVGNARKRFYEGEFQSTTGLRVFIPRSLYGWPEFERWAEPRQGRLRFTAGLDLGYQDADAFCVFTYVPDEADVWLIYEHKARRETMDELVQAIRYGIQWVKGNVPARDHSMRIYAETATLRYGHEGDEKKTAAMLREVYGLPIERAYKRDKKLGIELLQDVVNSGKLHIPAGGPFADECEQTIWTREADGTILRLIDDDSYHPDMMDAVLYPFRELWSYGEDVHKALPAPPEPPPPPSVDESFIRRYHEVVNSSEDVW